MKLKRRAAWIFLALGVSCLAAYLILVFKTSAPTPIMAMLVLSVLFNVVAVNLFYLASPRRRKEDE